MRVGSDFFYALIIIFILGAILFALTFAAQNILPILNTIPGYNTTPNLPNITSVWVSPYNATNSTLLPNYKKFDQFMPFIFILVDIAILASVIFLPVNVISIAITFPIMLVTVVTSFEFSNTMKIFFTNPLFANVIPLYPNTIALYSNIGLYEVIFFLLYIILVAAKAKMGGGGGGGSVNYGGGGDYGGKIGF